MPDELGTYSLTANIRVIDAIRKKWDVPPEAGKERVWWDTVGGIYCALCEHMAVVNGGEVWDNWACSEPHECPLNDTKYACSKEFEALANYMLFDVDKRGHFLELFTAMRDRVFALKPEDIPMMLDSDTGNDDN